MILIAPVKTEKAIGKIEYENTLTFVVALKATKKEILAEVEKLFGVKVVSVNTFITARTKKHALVRLSKESKADDIATKLKMIA
ncbi:50S ribosomal protein L23 [Candidatus Micrarchaeota archaeon]|nr:50S ribosomal protein L23 [Candidatus Micrarchaeota archaeon]MBU1165957.1 50S ribosomal protein L23 [Candidatus Micrarchaeota archaeon]MBU1886861.1 50S ribosomal protein L23 [Candidatus Micrarchaeota archaeon]